MNQSRIAKALLLLIWTLPSCGISTRVSTAGKTDPVIGGASEQDGPPTSPATAIPIPAVKTTPGLTVTISNPVNNLRIASPAYALVRAETTIKTGNITKVELLDQGHVIETALKPPFLFSWENRGVGQFSLVARISDDTGHQALSSPLIVNVVTAATGKSYFVNNLTGVDTNAGTQAEAPFKTISKAAQAARPGDVVNIAAGIYRETVTIPATASGTPEKFVTFRSNGAIIDGADIITGWTASSSSHPIYSAPWKHVFLKNGSHSYVDPCPVGCAEQFFANNALLNQVMTEAEMKANSFYVDWTSGVVKVWLADGSDPRKSEMSGSAHARLWAPTSTDYARAVHINGLNFRHAANFAQDAAVVTGPEWKLENVTVEYVNSRGIGLFGDNVVVLHTSIRDNGMMGWGANGISSASGPGVNKLILKSNSLRNNYKKFHVGFEAGGGKMSRVDGMLIKNFEGAGNFGPALWFDVFNKNFVVQDSNFHDNMGAKYGYEGGGIFIEISEGPARIQNSIFTNNTGAGVSIQESTNVAVLSNSFEKNVIEFRNMGYLNPDTGVYYERAPGLHHIQVLGNYFKNSRVQTSIGIFWEGWEHYSVKTTNAAGKVIYKGGKCRSTHTAPYRATDHDIEIDRNYYKTDNPKNNLISWTGDCYDGAQFTSLSDAFQTLGFEQHGQMGAPPQ